MYRFVSYYYFLATIFVMPDGLRVRLPHSACSSQIGARWLNKGCRAGGFRIASCLRPPLSTSLPFAPASQLHSRRWMTQPGRPTSESAVAEALETLHVTLDEGPTAWKSKYRALVKQHHPDTGGDAQTMAKLTVAYKTLTSLSPREREDLAQRLGRRSTGFSGSTGETQFTPRDRANRYTYARPNAHSTSHAYAAESSTNKASYEDQRNAREAFWSYYARHATPRGNQRTEEGSTGFSFGSFSSSSRDAYSSFSAANPLRGSMFYFGMRPHQRARYMTSRAMLFRGLAAYFLLLSVASLLYRYIRDKQYEYEWERVSRSARNDTLHEDLHRCIQPSSADAQEMKKMNFQVLWRILKEREAQQEMGEKYGWPPSAFQFGMVKEWSSSVPGIMEFEPSSPSVIIVGLPTPVHSLESS